MPESPRRVIKKYPVFMTMSVLDATVKATAKLFRVSEEELRSTANAHTLFPARYAGMKICRDLSHASFNQIGKAFNRDHSSVVKALQRPPRISKADLAEVLDEITNTVKETLDEQYPGVSSKIFA